MVQAQPTRLDRAVDPARDHVLGNPGAEITLVEYGSYTCPFCHAAHEVIADLRDRFGDRLRYVFRHRPSTGSDDADRAAELAEYAAASTDEFWPIHDALMKQGPVFAAGDLDNVGARFGLPPRPHADAEAWSRAGERVRDDRESARRSGALLTPTFFINGRRYEGPWDESSLAEAMLGSLGHRIQSAALDFARWAPSTGFLLLLMSLLAVALVNSPWGEAFLAFWDLPVGVEVGGEAHSLPLLDWINHGLLSVFFLVVGLEIKRELTVGHLASRSAAMLPVAASIGGMVAPAVIYLALIPDGPLRDGWGVPIATDTAFAIALVVLLGDRVPVELRIFLTAAVVVDDLVAITVVALFYSGEIRAPYLIASAVVAASLAALNRAGVYRPLPYALLGLALWAALHQAGLHATLAGVLLALATPTRPPANLRALMAQAETLLQNEIQHGGEEVLRHGPSEPALRAFDAIHDRIESPADKLLRSIEPWSSYLVLPLFALANAGVVLSADVIAGHARLTTAVIAGLVVGKPLGIVLAAWAAVRLRLGVKPGGS